MSIGLYCIDLFLAKVLSGRVLSVLILFIISCRSSINSFPKHL